MMHSSLNHLTMRADVQNAVGYPKPKRTLAMKAFCVFSVPRVGFAPYSKGSA